MLIKYRGQYRLAKLIKANIIQFEYYGININSEINCVEVIAKKQWSYSGNYTAGSIQAHIWADSPAKALTAVNPAPEMGQLINFKLTMIN